MNDKIEILYEDEYLIAINKPGTIPVQKDKTNDRSLIEILSEDSAIRKNLGLIHRLDRPVSGIVLFAKDNKTLMAMNDLFKSRDVKKIYWAVVENKPPKENDTIVHYILKNEKSNKSKAYDNEIKNSKKAELKYKLTGKSERYYFLEIELLTGRHHQIRAQLSAINCHIKGDIKYGFKRQNKDKTIHLHARQLSFMHPILKKEIIIKSSLPEDPLWNEFLKIYKS